MRDDSPRKARVATPRRREFEVSLPTTARSRCGSSGRRPARGRTSLALGALDVLDGARCTDRDRGTGDLVQLVVVPRDQHLAATMITTISRAARIASGLHASARSLLLPCSTSSAGSGARGAVQRSMQGASIAGAELRELGAVDVELGDKSCWRRASVAGVDLSGGAAAHQRRMRVRIPPATTTTVLCSGRSPSQKPRGIAQVRVTQVVGSC
jgi:hypothetical protein